MVQDSNRITLMPVLMPRTSFVPATRAASAASRRADGSATSSPFCTMTPQPMSKNRGASPAACRRRGAATGKQRGAWSLLLTLACHCSRALLVPRHRSVHDSAIETGDRK